MSSEIVRKPDWRGALLADTSRSLGKTWAEWWFDSLRLEGRPVAGGWPGTMSEARGRARAPLQELLKRHDMSPATHEEIDEAARIAYESAKALWFGSRVRDDGAL